MHLALVVLGQLGVLREGPVQLLPRESFRAWELMLRQPHAMLPLQTIEMGLAEKALELVWRLELRQLVGVVGPASLTQKRTGVHGTRQGVQDLTRGGAEIRGDVASLLLPPVDPERGDFLEGRDEMPVQILPDLGLGQGALTERLGIVSGEPLIVEAPGDV